MNKVVNRTIQVGTNEISIETGKLATQADGSVVVKSGGTMLLATIVSNKKPTPGLDFFPLTVDYREKFAAAGRFPGGFLKREARPSDTEILTSRLVDRALRPLFPDDYRNETQVLISLISTDYETMPDSLACFAASAALAVSDIPFAGPISEVRVARINGNFVVNPAKSDLELADLDLIIAATETSVVMVEGEMQEVSEKEMVEGIKVAHEAIKVQIQAQKDLASEVEKAQVKREIISEEIDEALYNDIHSKAYAACQDIARKASAKHDRSAAFEAIHESLIEGMNEEELEEKGKTIGKYFSKVKKEAIRRVVLDEAVRLDGRKTDEIRPIWTEVNYLPSPHGSAIFTRGETQSLTTVTLGNKLDEQTIDGAFHQGSERFLLHYNFPPFSTGEARPMRGTSRREVGHGNLALRALKPMVPTQDEGNPYTIRVVSDILESNGSSSMATVCAGSMALMDAGIGMKKPVSGIAMGLIMDEQGKYAVLSDILGDEDHLGDMDFKVTGTTEGITACQMDIKVEGLPYEILEKALEQARQGRLHILGEMGKTISEPREDYKEHAPRMITLKIDKEFIGAVIGPGGKIIQEMQKETNTSITIEEVDEVGIVEIMSEDKKGIDEAKKRIDLITAKPEVGEVYNGKVRSITSFGAFIEILPGKDGLLHISEIEWRRLNTVDEVLKEGEMVDVKLIAIDPKNGKLKLSRKVLLPKPEKV
jgi:polyribonucleotide nucleotidyltransferase